MANKEFDITIIGAGPGGYVCAIRAAQLGLKTALIEKRDSLGGTCLNVGCIPSKALLHSTELHHELKEHGKKHGLEIQAASINLDAILKNKDNVVEKLTAGVAQLCKARKIEVFNGIGRLVEKNTVQIKSKDKEELIQSKNIVLASGSVPVDLPFMQIDGDIIVSSDQAISFDKIPDKLLVIGAGAIGLELGSVWSRLGTDVSVVEFFPQIAPSFDSDIAKLAERIFKKQGLDIHTKTKVTNCTIKDGKALISAEKNGKEVSFEADKVLLAIGRKVYSEGLGLNEANVQTDERGRIIVDENLKTNIDSVWAIGDAIKGPMLAHKAEEEGVAVAERIATGHGHVNYDVIPGVIYTKPEIASVGITEAIAKEQNIDYKTGKFPLQANGRALAADAAEGMVKVIADAKTDRLLGVQILAVGASEIIAAAVAHMEYGGSAEDLGRTIHAHPTVSEALKEAALAVDKSAIHSL